VHKLVWVNTCTGSCRTGEGKTFSVGEYNDINLYKIQIRLMSTHRYLSQVSILQGRDLYLYRYVPFDLNRPQVPIPTGFPQSKSAGTHGFVIPVKESGFLSAITHSEVLTSVFTCVDISGLDICEDEGEWTRADTLAGKIWERTQFRFLCVSLHSCPT
jgi:hypothetical protein